MMCDELLVVKSRSILRISLSVGVFVCPEMLM